MTKMDRHEMETEKKEKDEIKARWITLILYPFMPYLLLIVSRWIEPQNDYMGLVIVGSLCIVVRSILFNEFLYMTKIRNVPLRLLIVFVVAVGAIGIVMLAVFLLKDLPAMVSVVILGVVIFIIAAIRLFRCKYCRKKDSIEK